MDHLTPDVLAAWIDGQLSAAERSAAEVHAADCAHCQAMLAAMARMAPPRPARAWWSAPAVRWLVPVAAATLILWVGSDLDFPFLSRPNYEAVGNGKSRSDPTTSVPHAKSESAKLATRSGKDQERRERTPSGDPPAAFGADERLRVDALAGATAPPPPPPAAPASPPAPPPPPVPLLPLQETVTVGGEAALAKSTARADAARMRPVEVISPERAYRWRSLTPGSIEYSMDGGMSWRPSSISTAVVLHAGSAPSRTVCWLVGQAGTVLLTIDGQNWQVRPFPERVDLTDVRATDARNATVTTSNLRRFATNDGGATWAPLQED